LFAFHAAPVWKGSVPRLASISLLAVRGLSRLYEETRTFLNCHALPLHIVPTSLRAKNDRSSTPSVVWHSVRLLTITVGGCFATRLGTASLPYLLVRCRRMLQAWVVHFIAHDETVMGVLKVNSSDHHRSKSRRHVKVLLSGLKFNFLSQYHSCFGRC
jgi:hypothetical protein